MTISLPAAGTYEVAVVHDSGRGLFWLDIRRVSEGHALIDPQDPDIAIEQTFEVEIPEQPID